MPSQRLALAVLTLFGAACSSPSAPPSSPSSPPPTAASEAPPSPAPTPAPSAVPEVAQEAGADVVLAHHAEIEACAATAHTTTASLAGAVEVRWSVSGTGAVSDVTLVSSTVAADPGVSAAESAHAFERCVLAAIGTWTYPAIEAEHVATVHHVFTIASSTGVPMEHRGSAHVHVGEPVVSRGLASELVQRIIRRHVNELRYCYEQEFSQTPSLAGRVTVHFGIDASGATIAPAIATSAMTTDDAIDGGEPARRVGACIVTTVGRWGFPAPTHAPVTVDAPLTLDDLLPVSAPATSGIGMGRFGTVGS